jgi:hypothetical protein
MQKKVENKKKSEDIEKVKNFLVDLGFVCRSFPSAHHLIYCKAEEKVIIKNDAK